MRTTGWIALAALSLFLSADARAKEPINPGAPPTLEIVSFTGEIQIITADSLIGVVPGTKAPAIPPGSEVHVVSGDAVFQSGDTAINAQAGANFTYNMEVGQKGQTVNIAAAPNSKPVTVTSGGHTAVVSPGASVRVDTAPDGKVTIAATGGNVTVTAPDGTTTVLGAGEQVQVLVAKAPSEPEPGPAPGLEQVSPPPPNTVQQNEQVEKQEDIVTLEEAVVSPSSP